MTTRHSLFGILSGLACFWRWTAFTSSAQSDPKGSASPKASSRTDPPVLVQVSGEVSHPLALSAADLAKLKHQTVRAKRHDGVESQFEGVPLVDILAKAGVPVGNDLRGPAMALYLVVEASDGYRAAFALAELDPAFTDRVDPPGRPPRRPAAVGPGWPAPDCRPRREEARALGETGDQAQGRPGLSRRRRAIEVQDPTGW